MSARVYVEGGGDTNPLKTRCRQAFRVFFSRAGLEGRLPRVFACGGRQQAYRDFCHAFDAADDGDFIVLLVDSEGPVAEDFGPWVHLKGRDNWDQPRDTTDENAHLMVQCMEAWFLADQDGLAAFFDQGFNRNALPGNPSIEEIAKADVLRGLKNATRQCRPKGEYGKGRHSFELLSRIEPANVFAVSPHAKRLVEILREKT